MIFIQRDGNSGTHAFTQEAARLLDRDGNVVIDWTRGGRLEGIPQGDGYTLETLSNGVVTREALAVGIVVLALGQSNMDGWFRDTDFVSPFAQHVYDLDSNVYRQPGAGATWFAKTLSDELGGVPVGFIDAAVGSTALLMQNYYPKMTWLADEPDGVYQRAIAALQAAGGKAEFTLWIQGESDVTRGNATYENYRAGFEQLVDKLQGDVPGTTIIVGGLGPRTDIPDSASDFVRQAQSDVAGERDGVHYVPTDMGSALADVVHLTNLESAWQAIAMARKAAGLTPADPDASMLGTDGDDVFDGTDGDDVYVGYAGADSLSGGAGADLLMGRDGKDTIDGGGGADYLAGGSDDDLLRGGTGNDLLLGDDGHDLLFGDDGDDLLKGGAGDDTLYGGAGNDTLAGGVGANSLIGGDGDDTYILNDSSDVVVETADGGRDQILAAANVVMSENVERLTFLNTSVRTVFEAIGNDLDNEIYGQFSSTYALHGGGGNDTIIGGYAADRLYGDSGNDVLDGGAGADAMHGGTGDDTFFVDNAGDAVIESEGEGTDWVFAKVEFTLPNHVENLSLENSFVRTGRGNDLDNILLAGRTTTSLSGFGGADRLVGGASHDTLDGGAGADTMIGNAGGDTYIVDDAGDVIIELANGGLDQVRSTISWTLGDNVENLTLLGQAALDGAGNSLANVITGNDGDNILTGAGGNDTLSGGSGIDRAVYAGTFSQYKIDRSKGIVSGGADGIDKLTGIEILQFADGNYLWDSGRFKSSNAAPALSFGQQSNPIVEAGHDIAGQATATFAVNRSDPDAGDVTRYDLSGWETKSPGVYVKSGIYGSIVFDEAKEVLTYTLDDSRPATEALAGDEIAKDSFTLGVCDLEGAARTHTIAVIVNGSNDVPPGNTIVGTEGNDVISPGSPSDGPRFATVRDDTIFGMAGDDTLNGGAGADRLYGGAGRDVYYVDDPGDIVDETVTQAADDGAVDTVWSSITFRLGQYVENLRLSEGNIDGTGNELANLITGSTGSNRIAGGRGTDSLYGKGGADTFVFAEMGAANRDSIWDFDANDRIELSRAVFAGIDANNDGKLDASAVTIGYKGAVGSGAQLVYNPGNGILSYDADGAGGAASQDIAFVGKSLGFLTTDTFVLAA